MVRWKGTLLIFEVIVAQKCTSQLLLLTSDTLMSTNVTPLKTWGSLFLSFKTRTE